MKNLPLQNDIIGSLELSPVFNPLLRFYGFGLDSFELNGFVGYNLQIQVRVKVRLVGGVEKWEDGKLVGG